VSESEDTTPEGDPSPDTPEGDASPEAQLDEAVAEEVTSASASEDKTPEGDASPEAQLDDAVAEDVTSASASEEASPSAAAPEVEGDEAAGEATGEPGVAADEEFPVTVEVAQSRVEQDFVDEVPREKPVIPGADLIPDIITDPEQFLDAEALAAAEAEAEEAAVRAAQEQEDSVEARPIADVAIDLAAGARYTATGKRKTAVARVVLKPGNGTYTINGKTLEQFFPRETLQRIIRQPLEAVAYESRMDVVARMHGGGVSSQAGALRHGISRALIVADPHLRGELKRRGFLTRDPRVKERKKAGLKKARKRPQFSKR
jgi:small subunit ribosomal protein S9